MSDGELRQRVIIGAAIGAVIIGSTLAGKIPSCLLVLVICTGSCYEFFRMRIPRTGAQNLWLPVVLSIIPLLTYLILNLETEVRIDMDFDIGWLGIAACVFMVYFFTQIKAEVVLLEQRMITFCTALLIFSAAAVFAIMLVQLTPLLLLGIFILIWSSDTFAYFGGRTFGKHKLLPSVSPKKTWEGFLIGLLAAGLAAFGLSYVMTTVEMQEWIVTGLLVAVFGTLGDLLQSAFKRAAGVKDSGKILPGHGGFWDRFDSFLGCIPWIGMYFLIF